MKKIAETKTVVDGEIPRRVRVVKEFDIVDSIHCPHEPKKCDIKIETGTKSLYRLDVCQDCLNSLKAGIDSQVAETATPEGEPIIG